MKAFYIIIIILLMAILAINLVNLYNKPLGIRGGSGEGQGGTGATTEGSGFQRKKGPVITTNTGSPIFKIDSIDIKYNNRDAAAVWLRLTNGAQYLSTNVPIGDAAALFNIVNTGKAEFDTARLELNIHLAYHAIPK